MKGIASTKPYPEQLMTPFRRRINMVNVSSETWRPQLFAPSRGRVAILLAKVRRFFDVQAGSAWRDLRPVLSSLQGLVLDVGCGAQPFRPLLHQRARYLGIDTDAAKAHFGYEMPDTTYFSGDVWPIADRTVDVVLCTETLEHVLETRQFLAEAARCLVPGGMLVLTVPFAARWHFIPYDYWRFTPSSLDYLLTSAGFVSTRVYARGNAVTVACYKLMTLLLRLLMPQNESRAAALLLRTIGICFLPLFLMLAFTANASLLGAGGDDCLGYTIFADRSH